MKRFASISLILLSGFTLAGCDGGDSNVAATTAPIPGDAPAAAGQPADDAGIRWYSGSVDEAFAYAKESGLPLFLYWGAEWCPPCHEIKVTVFKKREFIERSRLFVPVYLDGDTDNAQQIGERFGVLGYPTMVIFNADGTEITRIPGGIDIQAYANVLDVALASSQPVSTLLTRVMNNKHRLSASECRLMAYYSWGQDTSLLAELDTASVFKTLSDACPEQAVVERSILYVSYLSAQLAVADEQESGLPFHGADRDKALSRLTAIIDNYDAAKANIYSVMFEGANFTKALTDASSPERRELSAMFIDLLERMRQDESIFKSERLYTLRGKLRFERIDNPEAEPSDALQEEIRQFVRWADETTPDPYERQSVINSASNLLFEADMLAEAKALLLGALERATQPYYFMVSLADLEQEAGNHNAALAWLERAYNEATGPATRFQWGIYWVTGLIEMTPDDTGTITDATLQVFAEIETDKAFYQRPKRQMQSLERKLKAWNAEASRADSIATIRSGVQRLCAAIPAGQPARITCDGFLAEA